MTFYWWSHWFWITTLSTILLSITIVYTYPSQEISLEYNQNSKSVRAITKLHQTTTSLEWSTTSKTTTTTTSTVTTPSIEMDAVVESMPKKGSEEKEGSANEDLAAEDEEVMKPSDVELEADAALQEENILEADNRPNAEQLEYKRSAEVINKTLEEDTKDDDDESVEEPRVAAVVVQPRSASLEEGTLKLKRDGGEISNYTNHSRNAFESRNNKTCENCNTTALELNTIKAATTNLQAPKSARTASISTSNLSSVDTAHSETLDWLNAMAAAAALPPSKLLTNAPQSGRIDRETLTVTTESPSGAAAVGVVVATTVTAQQRIPFTLENANKEEELRRAENEHRSRKSKVLSAEYKHINRFINYSADTKSLLTRSASTARNEFDGGEENNISSEALSIQRTYFMDASAISAICFTIFGVCCTVGTIGIVLYRRRYLNKPQALSEPDSSVYIDDSTMRDNSDEMYSLDNDSFLNSLEAMTIQNYWTDTVKHTKL